MDGPAHEPIDNPVDPKLEALLRQELAVPHDSQERTMEGMALRLKDMPRTQARPKAKVGWWPRFLAAAVMLALVLGLFALLALTRGSRTPKSAPETGTSLASSKHSDPKVTKDDERPAAPEEKVETDPPLAEADLPKLLHGIEAGNASERDTGTRRLSHGGLLAKDALEKEIKELKRTGNNTEELNRLEVALKSFASAEEKEIERTCAQLDDPRSTALYLAPDPRLSHKLQPRVTFDFVDAAATDALDFITHVTGVRVVADSGLQFELPAVNLRVTDMPCDQALDWIARLTSLEAVRRSSFVFLTTPERAHRLKLQKHTFQLGTSGNDTPWTLDETKAVCNLLPQGSFHVDGAGAISGLADPGEAGAFERALKTYGDPSVRPDGPPEWSADTDRKLERRVTFDFVDSSAEEILNFLNSVTKINIIIDPKATANGKRTFDLHENNTALGSVLAQFCQEAGLAALYRNQALFLTTRPAELDGQLCVFDLRPALKAGVQLDGLSALLDRTIAEAPVKNRHAALLRSRLCAHIDPWTAGRINTILDEAAKTGKLPEPPPAPWFFETLHAMPPGPDANPRVPRQEHAPAPQVEQVPQPQPPSPLGPGARARVPRQEHAPAPQQQTPPPAPAKRDEF